ncbi:MAG: cupredoxin domain-containing protein [Chloroflexota bacterium]
MRLHRLLATGLVVAFALAGCGSGRGAGWTYAPAPSPTPVSSAAASGSPAASGPAASGSPGASAPAGATVTVVATTALRFDTPSLEVGANEPFTWVFDNRDATQPHNAVIHNPDGSKVAMGDTAFFTGPETRTYQVLPLAAGEYRFNCEVHPVMTGILTVR